jgi:hypothetical protein
MFPFETTLSLAFEGWADEICLWCLEVEVEELEILAYLLVASLRVRHTFEELILIFLNISQI